MRTKTIAGCNDGPGRDPLPAKRHERGPLLAAVALALLLLPSLPAGAAPQSSGDAPQDASRAEEVTLVRAAMCEGIRDLSPRTPAVVFSATLKKISCFTEFDPVPEKGYIYHRWFHRDRLSTTKKLFIKPPRWATVSSIQPRNTDRGPWRVEITDENGAVYHILRFSITD